MNEPYLVRSTSWFAVDDAAQEKAAQEKAAREKAAREKAAQEKAVLAATIQEVEALRVQVKEEKKVFEDIAQQVQDHLSKVSLEVSSI